MNKLIVDFFVILLLWILHVSFFNQFTFLIFINLPLLYVLLRIAFAYQMNHWWLVIFVGLLNDIYSLYFFGFYLVLYLVVAWFTYIILYFLFTNRTLLSLAAGVIIGSIVFKFIKLLLISFKFSFDFYLLWYYIQNLFITVFVESLILFAFVIIFNLIFSKKHV